MFLEKSILQNRTAFVRHLATKSLPFVALGTALEWAF
jgi:hypothetical protein